MEFLPLIILCYFAFHSYMLNAYNYQHLSGHTLYIIFLHIYLAYRKQPSPYTVLKQIAQKKSKQASNQNQYVRICQICSHVKPSRYYHCRRCKICIYRMDHHCQWIGNCIGQYNSKTYLHFLLNIFAHHIIVFFYVFVWNYYDIITNHQRSIYLLILILPTIFLLFETQRLLRDFLSMIQVNQTLIESYKKVKGKQNSIQKNLSQFFGNNSFLLWCIPFYLPFENSWKSSDLFEKVFPVEYNQSEPEDHTFADQYIYGDDKDDPYFDSQQNKKNDD